AIRALAGFRRVALAPGERRRVEFALDARALSFVDAAGRRRVEPGAFTVAVGGGQPGRAGLYASAAEGVIGRLEVTGEPFEIP
ncbi:MAG TPA: fibronectin type III-like domain-contianing protein, partial [Polyangia bacterium]|nr:fibronectin type III-like domain-contianing protein [Polyangia bacterium]